MLKQGDTQQGFSLEILHKIVLLAHFGTVWHYGNDADVGAGNSSSQLTGRQLAASISEQVRSPEQEVLQGHK
jgi:hypothetical protein